MLAMMLGQEGTKGEGSSTTAQCEGGNECALPSLMRMCACNRDDDLKDGWLAVHVWK